jgi:hypothetical protein
MEEKVKEPKKGKKKNIFEPQVADLSLKSRKKFKDFLNSGEPGLDPVIISTDALKFLIQAYRVKHKEDPLTFQENVTHHFISGPLWHALAPNGVDIINNLTHDLSGELQNEESFTKSLAKHMDIIKKKLEEFRDLDDEKRRKEIQKAINEQLKARKSK